MAVALVVYPTVPDSLMVPCAVWVVTLDAQVTALATNACLGNINQCSRLGLSEPALPHHLIISP